MTLGGTAMAKIQAIRRTYPTSDGFEDGLHNINDLLLHGYKVFASTPWYDEKGRIQGNEYILEAEKPQKTFQYDEAIKDFAERLTHTLVINNEENTEFFDFSYTLETIDNLVKEMTGEQE